MPFLAFPLDFDIPSPTACCSEDSDEQSIVSTCELDCAWAACRTAVTAIRAGADALEAPDGVPEGVVERSQTDLYAYADMLEAPESLEYCANKVRAHAGELTSIDLGEGVTAPGLLGHINSATITLGCMLDQDEPYEIDPEAPQVCNAPTHIPEPIEEHQGQGLIFAGAVTAVGPGVDTSAALLGADFEIHETLLRDGTAELTLERFDASFEDVSAGSFELRDPEVSLVRPATGLVEDELVRFAPGSLRFAVTATVYVDGSPLAEGRPQTAEYTNGSTTTAVRGLDGSFAFIDASVDVGDYSIVLNTEIADLVETPL